MKGAYQIRLNDSVQHGLAHQLLFKINPKLLDKITEEVLAT